MLKIWKIFCSQSGKTIKVNFTASECLVTNEKNEVILKGVRSKDNYYLWIPQETNCSATCLTSKEVEMKLFHKILDQLLLKDMNNVQSKEEARGISKLMKGKTYGEDPVGKQTKMSF